MRYTDEGRIIWKRLDVPGHESAWVFADEGNWIVDGSAVFLYDGRACRLDYLIECDDAWSTAVATVNGWVGDDVVDVEIEVVSGNHWIVNGESCPEMDGCIDIDLNFSPITNTLPIRRLDLSEGGSERVRSAWLRFPTFKLEPLAQTYTRLDKNTYRYESGSGTFVRELKVDEFGLVTDYPDYFRRESG